MKDGVYPKDFLFLPVSRLGRLSIFDPKEGGSGLSKKGKCLLKCPEGLGSMREGQRGVR